MIFVSVGTHKEGFDRLIKEIDSLIEKGIIKEEVFAQIGNGKYIPKNFKYVKFISEEEMEKQIKKCSTYITHGGVSLGVGLKYGKKVIVLPRLKKFNEAIDDHQVDVAIELEKNGKILYSSNENQILKKLKEKSPISKKGKKGYIDSLLEEFMIKSFK